MVKINKAFKGFTLIELLIVIAIISIIASVVFVSLDPLRRFRDSRDAKRWADITAVLSAIKIDQVDNGGEYMGPIKTITANRVYMITDGNVGSGCAAANAYCSQDVFDDASCVDLSDLRTQGYLGSVPVSPKGSFEWTSGLTGYTLEKSSTGILTIRACEAENTQGGSEIKAAR